MTDKTNQVRRRLLRWYERNRRDLPWRRTGDPYAIWVAETMLQQTQVKTMLPYYRRFVKRLPTLYALDRARLQEVLALWSGLGYYRRAENLKKAARAITREFGGRLPRDFERLRSLPGIGRYTAGALMSIAFDEPYPALDGNARRVLRRIFNLPEEKELWAAAGRLAAGSRPGDLNQALMELGATLCAPEAPLCSKCPVASDCAARRSGRRLDKPRTRSIGRVKHVDWPLALVHQGGKILLRRRTAGGILAGLWELPGGERRPRESLQAAVKRHLSAHGNSFDLDRRIGALRHAITHRHIRAPIFLFTVRRGARSELPDRQWRWAPLSSLGRYPVSAMTLKAASCFASYEKAIL